MFTIRLTDTEMVGLVLDIALGIALVLEDRFQIPLLLALLALTLKPTFSCLCININHSRCINININRQESCIYLIRVLIADNRWRRGIRIWIIVPFHRLSHRALVVEAEVG